MEGLLLYDCMKLPQDETPEAQHPASPRGRGAEVQGLEVLAMGSRRL